MFITHTFLVAGQQAVLRRAVHQRPHAAGRVAAVERGLEAHHRLPVRHGRAFPQRRPRPADASSVTRTNASERWSGCRRSSRPARRPSWASWSSSTGCSWATTSTSTPSTCRFRTGKRPGCCSRTSRAPCRHRLLQIVEAAYAIRSEPTARYARHRLRHVGVALPVAVPVAGSCNARSGPTSARRWSTCWIRHCRTSIPKHPKFGQEIKFGKDLKQVLEVCQEAARTPDGRVFVEDKAAAAEAQEHLQPARTRA